MKKKIACYFVVTLLIVGCMVGCTSKMTVWSLLINGEEVSVDTLLSINSEKISLFEYRFYFNAIKLAADNGDDSYWISNQDARDKLLSDTLDAIRYDYAKEELAKSLGLKITRSDKKTIKKYIKETKSVYTADKWQEMLDSAYMDEVLYAKYNYSSMYTDKLEEYYFGSESGNKLTVSTIYDYMQKYYHYKYIYIKYDYDETQTNKNLAENIIEKLANGAKFEDLMVYSRDYSEDVAKTGLFILKDGTSPIIDAVSKLEIGQSSGIIEQSDGYYIYMRYDITENDAKQNLQDFKDEYMSDFISEKVNEFIKKQNIEYVSEYYNKISIETLLH